MQKLFLILVTIVLTIILLLSGCDNPTSEFVRNNPNDPRSENFQLRNVPGLSAEIKSNGSIEINWWELTAYSVDQFIIEKSLGDSTSFEEIGRVDTETTQFNDESQAVRGDTYYRVSSVIEKNNREYIIGTQSTQLEFGELTFSTDYLVDEKRLIVNIETEHPLFTHFRIRSGKNISGEEGEPILFQSGQIENHFIDELTDITFSSRLYSVEALIIGNGFEDIALETEYSFNPGQLFVLEDLRISISNERDWILEWDDNVFFADSYRITKTVGGDVVEIMVPGDLSTYTDTTIIVTERTTPVNNQSREYRIEVFDEMGGQSNMLSRSFGHQIQAPIIDTESGNNLENSVSFELYNIDTDAVQLIIERAEQEDFSPLDFEIIATLDPSQTSFTDDDVETNKTYHYRVRTLTSSVYSNVAFAYQEIYDVTASFGWNISSPARIESTSDGRFIAWLEQTGPGHVIRVYDLLSNQFHGDISTNVSVRMNDIKLTPDEEFIYFSAPDERAIYRAEFPSGDNIVRVIENTDASNDQFGFGIGNIAISPDGSFIAGTGGIGHFAIYDRNDYSRLYTYSETGFHSAVLNINLAFSPVDNLIAINSNNQLTLHNIADGSLEMSFPAEVSSDQIGFSHDGTYVYTRDFGYAQLYNVNNGSDFRIWGGDINSKPGNDTKLLLGRQFVDLEQGRYTGTFGELGVNTRFLGQTELILKHNYGNVNIWSKTGEERWNFLYDYLYNFGGFDEPHSR